MYKRQALDVLENEHISNLNETEKQEFDFLKNRSDVLITPHIAGYSTEAFFKMSEILLQKPVSYTHLTLPTSDLV